MLAFINRLLPSAGGMVPDGAFGFESESIISPSPLTSLNEQAARHNNEMRPRSHAHVASSIPGPESAIG